MFFVKLASLVSGVFIFVGFSTFAVAQHQEVPYDRCCLYEHNKQVHFTEQSSIYDCQYICAYGIGFCKTYTHPSCPGCEIKYCFVATDMNYTKWSCEESNGVCIPFADGVIQCGHYGSKEETAKPATKSARHSCPCGVSMCVACPTEYRDEMLEQINDDKNNWQLGNTISRTATFYCDCQFGCDEV